MSKRKKNYPDPMAIVNSYGADALRYVFLKILVESDVSCLFIVDMQPSWYIWVFDNYQ